MTVTFENLPQAVSELHEKFDRLLSTKQAPAETDTLMTVPQFMDYLPDRPAKQTVYQWVWGRTVPYEKHGKRLYFRKSTIDNWLANGRQIKS